MPSSPPPPPSERARGASHRAAPAKFPVSETPISNVRLEPLLRLIDAPAPDRATIVTFCNVHSVMTARHSPPLAEAIASSDVASPDGMPVAWWIRYVHGQPQARVFGPGTMDAALRYGVERGWRHYLYGSTEETIAQLRQRLPRTHPGAIICGAYAPPFRPLTPPERTAALANIRAARPTIVWVGLGMPKQELWMQEVRDELPDMTLAGVGAAFDMLAGRVAQAPRWMRATGLEWLFRLGQEPRRLWRRYAVNNPAFLMLLARELVAGRLTERRV